MRPLHALLEPPEDHRGEFAWLCGFGADAETLDATAERFTRLMRGQRAHEGRIWIGALLDRSVEWIRASACPGVAHLRLPSQPWRLLHAKLALASFQGPGNAWAVRVVVTTGNWTRGTLEDSLDLAWSVDVTSSDLAQPTQERRLAMRDISVAARVFRRLRDQADQGLLSAADGPVAELNRRAASGLDAKLKKIRSAAGKGPTRLFSNRKKSVRDQILDRLDRRDAARLNTLVMGSGFYESGGDELPQVPARLVQTLQASGHATRPVAVHLVAQPDACQAVAAALGTTGWKKSRWTAWRPNDPSAGAGTPRKLHAKFVLGGNWRTGSNGMGRAWLYLGSGNLTAPGFERKAGPSGNLEAGVVVDPGIGWDEVSTYLPIGWDQDPLTSATTASGGPPPEPDWVWVPPLAFVRAEPDGETLLLCPPEPVDVEILGLDGTPCRWQGRAWVWTDPMPLDVMVRSDDGQARIPVVDASGRTGGEPLRPLAFDDALPLLLAFPDPPEEDELDSSDDSDEPGIDPNDPDGVGSSTSPGRSTSPVRQMTQLLETVAAIQCAVDPDDWLAWTVRLEQTLVRVADSPVVEAFQRLELDPLPVLARPAFVPEFARSPGHHGDLVALLERVRKAWGVDGLAPLIPETP